MSKILIVPPLSDRKRFIADLADSLPESVSAVAIAVVGPDEEVAIGFDITERKGPALLGAVNLLESAVRDSL